MSRLDDIKARLAAITPGKWKDGVDDEGWLIVTVEQPGKVLPLCICSFGDLEDTDKEDHANARFLGAAPDDMRWLIEQVERLQQPPNIRRGEPTDLTHAD